MSTPAPVQLRLALCPPRDTDGVRLVRHTLATALTESGGTDHCRDEVLTAPVEAGDNAVQFLDVAVGGGEP